MALSAELINGFSASLLAKRFDNVQRTPDFHLELWELCCSSNPYVAIAAPRAHAKSTAVTHAYTLASVLFRDRRFVVLVSDTETQASNFLNDIKEELRNNDDLIELFQIKGFKKDTETDIIVECMDGHTFRIIVRGAEQRVRGLKWMQMRPDLIICHERDTDIYTPETGWIKNQNYPKAKEIEVTEAYEIVFEDGTTEVVSADHRYLVNGEWEWVWSLNCGDSVDEKHNNVTSPSIQNEEQPQLPGTIIRKRLKNFVQSSMLLILLSMLQRVRPSMRRTKILIKNAVKSIIKSITRDSFPTMQPLVLNVEQ